MKRANATGYFRPEECKLSDFAAQTTRKTNKALVPHAVGIEQNVPVYDAQALATIFQTQETRKQLLGEFAYVLMDGPGALILKQVFRDGVAIDAATDVFNAIIADEKEAGTSQADHFAKAGANDRIWNSLQKLCLRAPDVFAHYHALPAVDAVCEAWLGPNYQVTAQVNLIRPSGDAQQPHRDYHLGFQTAEISAAYPAHVHHLSPCLTLQGGIAHVDIPVEAGPTKLLPFSQAYGPGYVAWRRPDFQDHFEENYIQLPLQKGDAIFFNPALFHAGGANRSADVDRLVNLLQVSSAFGRAMEAIDRKAMCKALYPVLAQCRAERQFSTMQEHAAIAACAEGYAFPTNLDHDPPVGGLAPKTQQALFFEALNDGWDIPRFEAALETHCRRQQP